MSAMRRNESTQKVVCPPLLIIPHRCEFAFTHFLPCALACQLCMRSAEFFHGGAASAFQTATELGLPTQQVFTAAHGDGGPDGDPSNAISNASSSGNKSGSRSGTCKPKPSEASHSGFELT